MIEALPADLILPAQKRPPHTAINTVIHTNVRRLNRVLPRYPSHHIASLKQPTPPQCSGKQSRGENQANRSWVAPLFHTELMITAVAEWLMRSVLSRKSSQRSVLPKILGNSRTSILSTGSTAVQHTSWRRAAREMIPKPLSWTPTAALTTIPICAAISRRA